MRERRAGPFQLFRAMQCAVSRFEFLKLFPAVLNILGGVGAVEIAVAGPYEHGLWRKGIEEIPAVEAKRTGVDKVLFGVVGRTRRNEGERSDILDVAHADRSRGQPVVGRGQQHGERASSGM